MKRLSTLALVAAVGLFQTGCFNSTADNNQPQEAQAASIAAPATAQPAAAPAQAVAPAAPAQAAAAPAAPVAAASALASPAPVAAAPAAPQVNANTFFVSTNDGTALNVRSTNSTQSQVIGSFSQGSQVQLHESDRSGEWFEVSADGVRGWVAAAYLIDPNGYRAAGSVPAQVAPAPAPQAYSAYDEGHFEFLPDYFIQTRDGDSLNMREGASLNARVLRALPNETQVMFIDSVGLWAEVIISDGSTGYVSLDYLVSLR